MVFFVSHVGKDAGAHMYVSACGTVVELSPRIGKFPTRTIAARQQGFMHDADTIPIGIDLEDGYRHQYWFRVRVPALIRSPRWGPKIGNEETPNGPVHNHHWEKNTSK